jgi:cytochrome b involved in lipid metabolism
MSAGQEGAPAAEATAASVPAVPTTVPAAALRASAAVVPLPATSSQQTAADATACSSADDSSSDDDDELDIAALKRSKVPLAPGHSQLDWARKAATIPRRPGWQTKTYTMEQVAMHANPKHSVWMVLRGKVYDVTEYMAYHPGNVATLLQGAGKDATRMFDKIHACVNVDAVIGSLCIGRLVA